LSFPQTCGSPTSWRLAKIAAWTDRYIAIGKQKQKQKQKQKILGKVKIEKKKTPHHIAKDAAKKNGRR
jgi:hypothetical protein